MERRTENKIVLIIRRTRIDDLIIRFNTQDQARFYVEHLGADFSDYQAEDRIYKAAVRETENVLSRHGRVQVVQRSFLPNFIFGANDTVVALGQDGLVANVLKYLDGQPLIGVNPDPARWEGILLPFRVNDLDLILPEVFARQRPIYNVTMAEAKLNTGETLCGVNDLFIGPKSHTSARYTIQMGKRSENHSSSGIIVSTGLGSTGWFRSVVTGATAVAEALAAQARKAKNRAQGKAQETTPPKKSHAIPWDANFLYFSVREPWPSTSSKAEITFGKVTASQPLVLVSQMPEHGVIFSDGIEADFLRFNAGTSATIGIAKKQGHLVA